MKSAYIGLTLCLVLALQGCSQKTGVPNTTNPAGNQAGGNQAGPPTNFPPSMPKSQQYFEQFKSTYSEAVQAHKANRADMEKQKLQECSDLLAKSLQASKDEKNTSAIVFCNNWTSRIKAAQNDKPGAIAVLESTISGYDSPSTDDSTLKRMDETKSLLASLYAIDNKADKAEALYKNCLVSARQQKPVNHERVAFWLQSYAQFYKFEKNDSKSQAMVKEAQTEYLKGAQGGGPGRPARTE